jgi:hypothetical protein
LCEQSYCLCLPLSSFFFLYISSRLFLSFFWYHSRNLFDIHV